MTPWTALLESLHSALIDELTDRHPEPKPGLGLPIRQREFAYPSQVLDSILTVPVSFEDVGTGAAFLGLDSTAASTLGIGAQDLWNAITKRAGAEFHRRGIKPRFMKAVTLSPRDEPRTAEVDLRNAQRIVWIPFTIDQGHCFLGLGV